MRYTNKYRTLNKGVYSDITTLDKILDKIITEEQVYLNLSVNEIRAYLERQGIKLILVSHSSKFYNKLDNKDNVMLVDVKHKDGINMIKHDEDYTLTILYNSSVELYLGFITKEDIQCKVITSTSRNEVIFMFEKYMKNIKRMMNNSI